MIQPNETLRQAHAMLDNAGVAPGEREDILPLTHRIALLIDERNSLKDELDSSREALRDWEANGIYEG